MDRAFLTWDPDVVRIGEVAASPHPLLGSRGFYCLIGARLDAEADQWKDIELLFVGGAHDHDLRTSVATGRPEHDKAVALAQAAGKEVVAMLGELSESTLGRVTRGFLDDIEHCLALRNDPKVSQIPDDFKETRHLSVVNRGDFAPLNWRSLMRPV